MLKNNISPSVYLFLFCEAIKDALFLRAPHLQEPAVRITVSKSERSESVSFLRRMLSADVVIFKRQRQWQGENPGSLFFSAAPAQHRFDTGLQENRTGNWP